MYSFCGGERKIGPEIHRLYNYVCQIRPFDPDVNIAAYMLVHFAVQLKMYHRVNICGELGKAQNEPPLLTQHYYAEDNYVENSVFWCMDTRLY